MNLRLSGPGSISDNNIELPFRWSEINMLICLHVLFYILYSIAGWMDWLSTPLAGRTTADFIRSGIAISLDPYDMQYFHWGSLFAYQFVHSSAVEITLNMMLLWVFGHTLRSKIGEKSVMLLYFAGTMLSALVFIISHYVFTVYTGITVMEGAFGGVLTLVAATAIYFRSNTVLIGDRSFSVMRISVLLIALSFVVLYQHTIAFILIFIACIFAGGRYAAWQTNMLRPEPTVVERA